MEDTLLENYCRVCLSVTGDESFDLFERNANSEDLAKKLETCCQMKLKEFNTLNMPSKICTKCNVILNMCYNFAKMCRTTQDYLESLSLDTLDGVVCKQEEELHKNKVCHDPFENFEFCDEQLESDDERKLFKDYIDEVTFDGNDEDDREEDELIRISKVLSKRRKKSKHSTFMCSVCGNMYNNKATFNYHMSCHFGHKDYECEICHKKFRQSTVLTNHMRIHTGERPFKCQYCYRDFADKSSRQRHERIHTNERPYRCDVCDKAFTYSGILKKHKRTHTGEKPHHCKICKKSFAEPHQLKAHLETLLHRKIETNSIKEYSSENT